ncbi:metal-dependent hydrolase [Halospeciosus flavus]|uniref:Metal-dependent hydrolase n=1 Tax=Halospeciosus flavus TaxID=3032283 RepID=A0ABD5Z366_9EURY|nr:metal-dependent hydrolase [Halospeciosus flavus]
MLPLAHAAIGLLAYAGVQLPRDWRSLTVGGAAAALLGSQFPDLIDKPLAYMGLIPSGRSVAYSLFVLGVVGLFLYVYTPSEWRLEALAFLTAALSHPLVDAHQQLLEQGVSGLPGYLLWPITQAPRYGDPAAPWLRVVRIYSSPDLGLQTLGLLAIVGVVFAGRAAVELYQISEVTMRAALGMVRN